MSFRLDRLAQPFVALSERFYPDPFVFAIGLTGLAFLLVTALTPTGPAEALVVWGAGLTGLLAFMTQVCLTLVCAHALAHTDVVRRGIDAIAGCPRGPGQAYALVVWVAGGAGLIAGALGLVVGGLIALAVARRARERGIRLHFPLLVAGAYAGFMVWHMGYSSTAALFVATPGHSLEGLMGQVPVTETIFAPWNITIALVTLAVTSWVCAGLAPTEREVVELPEDTAAVPEREAQHEPATPARRLDQARVLSLALGLLLTAYLVHGFVSGHLTLTFDVVNWSFLASGLLLTRSPRHYVDLVLAASRTVGPILLQYPFYAGVMALVTQTQLVDLFSDGFVSVATAETLGFWAFLSGGLLNFFVPSGGGQWVVQGPIFVEAARQLGVADPVVVMGVAYGDQWTNMIQPFWTLPLLAIVGLRARAIMGYCFVIFLAGFFCFGAGLLWVGAGLSR